MACALRMRMFAEGSGAAVRQPGSSKSDVDVLSSQGLEENLRFSQNLQALEYNLMAIESGQALPELKRHKSPLLVSPLLSPSSVTPTRGITRRKKHSLSGREDLKEDPPDPPMAAVATE